MTMNGHNPGEELSSVPLGDLIHSVAVAIADGQFQLAKSGIREAEFMGGRALLRDLDTGQLLTAQGRSSREPQFVDTRVYFGYHIDENGERQPNLLSMMELGFVPTFYQFVETVIDLRIALRLRKAGASGATVGASRGGSQTVVTATPVDARYASSYSYSADMSSKVSTKLVPVPPPHMLEERIRGLIEREAADHDRTTNEAKAREPRTLSAQPLGGPAFDVAFYRMDQADVARQLVTGAFTVEAWVAPTAFRPRDGVAGVFLDRGTSATGWLLGVFDGKFGFALSTAYKPNATVVKARRDYAPGEWHHVAGVYDGAEMRLYVDGQLQNGSADHGGVPAYADAASFTIGAYAHADGVAPFAGRIDDVRLWHRALDGDRIRRDMNIRLQGSEPELVGYWRLDNAHEEVLPDAVAGRDVRKVTA